MSGRIRQLKPELALDEKFWALVARHPDLHLYQAFTALWCHADREGRFEWRPQMLKTQILPYWDGDFAACLEALRAEGLIVQYEVDGKPYGLVKNFLLHQRPNSREPASRLPPPPAQVPLTHAQVPLTHAQVRSDEGLAHAQAPRAGAQAPRASLLPTPDPDPESQSRERAPVASDGPKSSSAKSIFAPADFAPTPTHRVRCQELRLDVDALLRAFKLHEFNRAYSDWDRRFSLWIEQERLRRETERAKALPKPTIEQKKPRFDATWNEWTDGCRGYPTEAACQAAIDQQARRASASTPITDTGARS